MEIRIPRDPRLNMALLLIVLAALFGIILTCALSQRPAEEGLQIGARQGAPTALVVIQPTSVGWGLPTMRPPGAPIHTPTPDAPHALPSVRTDPDQYMVQAGDTLGSISERYGVSIEQIALANELINPDVLSVGQVLTIPVPTPGGMGPDFKIIPDSELVYGPANIIFDVENFVNKQGGYLANYREEVEGRSMSGAQIVERVARDYSVSARLLLAILQYQSGWLTEATPTRAQQEYPLGLPDPLRAGLFRQLSWAANNLNRGFYLWRVNALAVWVLGDGSIVPIAPTINAGTAGVQHMYALLYGRPEWEQAISPWGLFVVYNSLFGYPFDYAIEPALPLDLVQSQAAC